MDDLEAFLWTEAIVRKITESSRRTCGHVGLLGHLVLLLLVPVVRLALLHLAHLDYLLCSTCHSSCVDRPKAGSRRRLMAWVLGPSLTIPQQRSALAAGAHTKLTSPDPLTHILPP